MFSYVSHVCMAMHGCMSAPYPSLFRVPRAVEHFPKIERRDSSERPQTIPWRWSSCVHDISHDISNMTFKKTCLQQWKFPIGKLAINSACISRLPGHLLSKHFTRAELAVNHCPKHRSHQSSRRVSSPSLGTPVPWGHWCHGDTRSRCFGKSSDTGFKE